MGMSDYIETHIESLIHNAVIESLFHAADRMEVTLSGADAHAAWLRAYAEGYGK